MTKLTLREASRLISTSAMTKGTSGYQFEAAELQTRNIAPVLEAEIAAVRAVSELLRAQRIPPGWAALMSYRYPARI